jgi:hypothetical protein
MSGVMRFSLPDNGHLIIGQSFLFTVQLFSDEDIGDNQTMSFYNNKNINVPTEYIPLIIESDKKSAIATVTITVPSDIDEGEDIYFTVQTSLNGIQSKTLKYTAKTIYPNSLELNVDTVFLSMPISYNDSQIGTISTKVHATIRDNGEIILSGTPVFITSEKMDGLDGVFVYANDKLTKINIQRFGFYFGFFINSDNKGKIEFYIYPKPQQPVIIKLVSIIVNSTAPIIAKSPIFVSAADDIIDYNRQPLFIITEIDGNITSEGESMFGVGMSPCIDYITGDVILFFVNDEYKYHALSIGNYGISPCFIKLPYIIFQENEQSQLSYIVMKQDGNTVAKSHSTSVTYRGRPNQPWIDVRRIYEPCKVYSSFDTLIDQNNIINSNTIFNHASNPNDAGLFVRITGTNDNSDNTMVKLGSEVTLILYINSLQRTITHIFKGIMPYRSDNADGKTAILKFNIPYDLLDNNLAFSFGGGSIFFDYQIGDEKDNDVTYGNIWRGVIVTP